MNIAVITNGLVTNVIVGDATTLASSPGPGVTLVDIGSTKAWIGWSYAAGKFTAPAAPAPTVPQSVTRLQARLALQAAGLLTATETAVTAAGGATLIWYQDAQLWDRLDPILNQLGQTIGLTGAQIDALFTTAAGIAPNI